MRFSRTKLFEIQLACGYYGNFGKTDNPTGLKGNPANLKVKSKIFAKELENARKSYFPSYPKRLWPRQYIYARESITYTLDNFNGYLKYINVSLHSPYREYIYNKLSNLRSQISARAYVWGI